MRHDASGSQAEQLEALKEFAQPAVAKDNTGSRRKAGLLALALALLHPHNSASALWSGPITGDWFCGVRLLAGAFCSDTNSLGASMPDQDKPPLLIDRLYHSSESRGHRTELRRDLASAAFAKPGRSRAGRTTHDSGSDEQMFVAE
jgi:hypothetical protein